MMNPQLSVAGIGIKIYQNLGRFSSLLASIASLKMKGLKAPVDFTRFHRYFQIKPGKDELTVGAAPIRSVLQPWITRIPGAEKTGDLMMRTAAFSSSLQISCSHYLIFNLLDLLICFYKAFCRKRRSLLLQPASSLPSDSAAVDISPESAIC